MNVKVFKYKIVKEAPIEYLENFKNHRRLSVFFNKGTKCVNCERKGTKLILGKSKAGSLHWDVYTDELIPMTVDHIKPISKGGNNLLENKQPMCYSCNTKKGNGDTIFNTINFSNWPRIEDLKCIEPSIGSIIYRKHGKKYIKKGVVSELLINPFTNKLGFKVRGNNKSIYSCKKCYELSKQK